MVQHFEDLGNSCLFCVDLHHISFQCELMLIIQDHANELHDNQLSFRVFLFRLNDLVDKLLLIGHGPLPVESIQRFQSDLVNLLSPLNQSFLACIAQDQRCQQGCLDLVIPVDTVPSVAVVTHYELQEARRLAMDLHGQILVNVVATSFDLVDEGLLHGVAFLYQ